jgi:hypothetical protein
MKDTTSFICQNLLCFSQAAFRAFFFSLLLLGGYGAVVAGAPSEQWNQTFGGGYGDGAWCLQETVDGGFILAGNTASRGEGSDLFLVKADESGNYTWSRAYGGSGEDVGYFVQQTDDGGYVVVGSSNSYAMGEELLWLVKVDENGSLIWDKTFGGFVSSAGDGGWSAEQTGDGGYIASGYTQSSGAGRKDLWLIKTDALGGLIWEKSYGGQEDDVGMSVLQSRDGGYIVAGRTASFGEGGDDIWLLKTDSLGKEIWNETYGGRGDDAGFQVVEEDDGYSLVGRTESGEEDKRILLIRVDQQGEVLWENSYSGGSVASLQPTYDGGYIMAGRVDSNEGKRDALLIKADSGGAEQWSMRLGGRGEDIGTYALQSRDGSFLLAGITSSFGQGREDAWLAKLGEDAALEKQPQSNLSFSLYPISSAVPQNSGSINSAGS